MTISAVVALPIIFFAAQPASAAEEYDGENAATIELVQVPTSIFQPSDPGTVPTTSSCDQPFPANPVVICGRASFGDRFTNGAYSGKRDTTGLPGDWTSPRSRYGESPSVSHPDGWNDTIGEQFQLSHRTAKDLVIGGNEPTSLTSNLSSSAGTNLQYMSRSVGWRELRNWTQGTNITNELVTVTLPPSMWIPPRTEVTNTTAGVCKQVYSHYRCTGGKGCPGGYAVYKTVCTPGTSESTTYPGYWIHPSPVTVNQVEITDFIWGNSGGFAPRTFTNPGTYKIPVTKYVYYPIWQGRAVTYGGLSYYSTPETKQVWCQAELGPGEMTGPYGHNGKPLNSQIGVNKSDLDPQTTLRSWWTRPPGALGAFIQEKPGGGFIKKSNIGERAENAPQIFKRGNTSAEALVRDCIEDKPSYVASANNQPCKVLDTTSSLYGQELPATHELCQTFVPGNYNKDLSESKEMLCTYTVRDWIGLDPSVGNFKGTQFLFGVAAERTSAAERVTFIHCGEPVSAKNNPDRSNSPNSITYPTTKAFWACSGDTPEKGNGQWHPKPSYDFLTCGITYTCSSPGEPDLRPTILDLNSNTSTRGSSQILASGAQTRVSWNVPTQIIGTNSNGEVVSEITVDKDAENTWQTWNVIDGSSPWYFDKSPNDGKQSVFGSNVTNVNPTNADSILNSGVNNWNTRSIYLRGYKGTSMSSSATNVGELDIPANSLVPFGVNTEYSTTIPKVTTVFGESVVMNQPVTCTMPPAYLYYLSGRATG
jgi:hypothetical protein